MSKTAIYWALILISGLILSLYLTTLTSNIDYYNFYSAFVVGVAFTTFFNFITERKE